MSKLSIEETETLWELEEEELAELQTEIQTILEQGRLLRDAVEDEAIFKMFTAKCTRIDATVDKYESVFHQAKLHARMLKRDTKSLDLARRTVRTHYFEILAMATPAATTPPLANSTQMSSTYMDRGISLPKINLPSFSGDLISWPSFRDTFKSLVHDNATLDDIQKYHYLRAALKGVAFQTISSVPLTAHDYSAAWELLIRRYDNKRLLATTYLIKILTHKPILKPSLNSLEEFTTTVLESAESFLNLNIPDAAGFILYTMALRLLDQQTREKFEATYGRTDTIPTFSDFGEFIFSQQRQLQTSYLTAATAPSPLTDPPLKSRHIFLSLGASSSSTECPYCKEHHRLMDCIQFRNVSVNQRSAWIREQNRCLNCLASGHAYRQCPSSFSCRHCHERHHSLLHWDASSVDRRNQTESSLSNKPKPTPNSNPPDPLLTASATGDATVLLSTVKALILDGKGAIQPIRMLVDSGSQRSFVTGECVQRLGLPTRPSSHHLVGLGESSIAGGTASTDCQILSRYRTSPILQTTAIVIDRISGHMPPHKLPSSLRSQLAQYELADPTFDQPGPVEFLLGADLFGEIITGPAERLAEGFPLALPTIFGWTLLGKVPSKRPENTTSFLVTDGAASQSEDLEHTIRKFWEIEEVAPVQQVDPLHQMCEEHFDRTHRRDEKGRYTVLLPFKTEPDQLIESKWSALNRYHKLEHRFTKDTSLKEEYDKIMHGYLENGYMSPAQNEGKHFLPHHPVVKESTSTKVRVVLDASCRTSHGSLNDHLLTGPALQNDIKDVLLQFRVHKVAMTSDIAQMYLQIEVQPDHRRFQHIFYRFDRSQGIVEYELNRLAFGMSCSPFVALRVLKQLVQDEGQEFPHASVALKNAIYVDDILAGGETVEEAKTLQTELIQLLRRGGFELKKWCSTHEELTQNVPTEARTSPVTLSEMQDAAIKILGMQWEPSKDQLSYRIQPLQCVPTKRAILSTIARMYDPLGYLSPVIFKAKCLLQRLWGLKLEWDDSLPEDLANSWNSYYHELPCLRKVSISRCLFPGNPKNITIVGFADASSLGYAAVMYLRTEFDDGQITTNLICSKTKLAPLKPCTIPRLELCAALLLTKLFSSLQTFFAKFQIHRIILLSDSSTVLAWLQSPLHRLKVFVANRASKILDTTSPKDWYHVHSPNNMADLASRGCEPNQLLSQSEWWHGPKWINEPITEWPIRPMQQLSGIDELPDTKPEVTSFTCLEMPQAEEMFSRFSTFTKLINAYTYVYRFLYNARHVNTVKRSGPITLSELRTTTESIIKLVQRHHFTDSKNMSSVEALNPFEDSRGIFRVGGRLTNAPIPYGSKHPILLPRKSHLTTLIVDHYHASYLHAGPQLLHSLLRTRYWIPSPRNLIRKRVHQCLRCHKIKSMPRPPFMGDLPPSRFEQGRPFINVGADFAGPFLIRESPRRKALISKAYFCLFVCLSTKAVHIELVSQLTTDAFIACFDRFVARRGLPYKVCSDNGTNFVGARRKLQDLYEWIRQDAAQAAISSHARSKEIEWHFSPPGAPHFGGLWEAGVKSLKFHLTRVLDQHPLTFEELTTIGARVEAVLNSRPLHPLSDDPNDLSALTPGHFLIGGPLVSAPQLGWEDRAPHLLTRWQFLQQCIADFWKRWRLDYLATLQPRGKWRQRVPNLKEGTMVLLKESHTAILNWPIARVTQLYPGKDGTVRVAKIRTSTGEYVRPVTSLAPLLPESLPVSVE